MNPASDYLIDLFEGYLMNEAQQHNPCGRRFFAVLLDDDRELPDGSHDVQNCSFCYYPSMSFSCSRTWQKYGIQLEDIAYSAGRMHP